MTGDAGLLASLGTELLWQVLGSVLTLAGAVWAGLGPLQRRRTPPALLVAGAAAAALLPAALGRVLFVGWGDPETLLLRATTFAGCFVLGPLTAGPTIGFTALLAAAASARGTPRRWGRPAAVAGLALALAAGVALGLPTPNPLFAWVRAAAYAGLGLLLAVGAMGAGPEEEAGGDAAAACGALFPIVVGLGEASERGLVALVATGQLPQVAPDQWATFVTQIREVMAAEYLGSFAAVAAAIAVGAVAAVRPGPSLVRSLGGLALGAAVGLTVVAASDLPEAKLASLAPLASGASEPAPAP